MCNIERLLIRMLLWQVKVPANVFPDYKAPAEGFWEGRVCHSAKEGGTTDVAIKIPDEEVFSRPALEVRCWLSA